VLDAYEEVKKSFPDLKLILAPRHPERFNEAEEILKRRNLNFIRRTEFTVDSSQFTVHSQQADIILLDTIGELSRLFSKADVTFIGGSLLPFGGHNILEPAYWGKPSIFGPHMENFPIAKDFLMEGAAIMVKEPGGLAAAIKDLLENTEKAEHMGQKAKGIIDKNTGAVKKAVALVGSFLGNS
ncbi:MAG TPA: 3-deoxy-D-manno-octulosonic acid transferase, partial [Thermodesulfovibrionia bacterium]|nr:3-deoxy-D-manno-octulosonic acid transferase [Thermodesulfovibrionia bacterium]